MCVCFSSVGASKHSQMARVISLIIKTRKVAGLMPGQRGPGLN